MSTGIPLEVTVMMSREVKSGLRNWSFSKEDGQGSWVRRFSAELSSSLNF